MNTFYAIKGALNIKGKVEVNKVLTDQKSYMYILPDREGVRQSMSYKLCLA